MLVGEYRISNLAGKVLRNFSVNLVSDHSNVKQIKLELFYYLSDYWVML